MNIGIGIQVEIRSTSANGGRQQKYFTQEKLLVGDAQKSFTASNFGRYPSINRFKYLSVSLRMLFRECMCKNAGVAGYAEAFTHVLSGKQTSET